MLPLAPFQPSKTYGYSCQISRTIPLEPGLAKPIAAKSFRLPRGIHAWYALVLLCGNNIGNGYNTTIPVWYYRDIIMVHASKTISKLKLSKPRYSSLIIISACQIRTKG